MSASTASDIGQLPEPTTNNNTNQASLSDEGKCSFKSSIEKFFELTFCKIVLNILQILDTLFLISDIVLHFLPDLKQVFKHNDKIGLGLDTANILRLLWLLYQERCHFFAKKHNYIEVLLYSTSIAMEIISLGKLVSDSRVFNTIQVLLLICKMLYAGYDLGIAPCRRMFRKKERELEAEISTLKERIEEFELESRQNRLQMDVPPQSSPSPRATC